jgi:multidrug resistance efflux pump
MMQPVASVAQIENVKVTVGVSASDIGRIRKGQSVRITVDVFPDREFLEELRAFRLLQTR